MAEDNLAIIKDEVLQNASLEANKSGNIMPFLKVELQCKIQCRRLERGQDEIDLRMSSPPRKRRAEVTKEESERMEKRKEQNKTAARKFREKEKKEKAQLHQTVKDLQKKNEDLRAKIQQMEAMKAKFHMH
ncbi:cyclic AMP-dependent transcription factor ATF-3-like [Ostrea edulis]|uniref:cyclic AMP-dependent transcription factor ATF-3-like n=1 Tax=Ostrea edulis TaxID=37623 RepID=UPI0024AF8F75|nr:cyclic AMP-dependent transcription factor ATF-3-like [Ostrea edulis]